MHIEIVEDSDLIAWRYTDPTTKVQSDSVLHLRVVPEAYQRALRKKYTSFDVTRRGREPVFDWENFTQACIDYAIVKWESVKRLGVDLPCEIYWKMKLPDPIRAEVIRLCVGREMGDAILAKSGGDLEAAFERQGDEDAPDKGITGLQGLPDPNSGSGRT